MKIPLHSSTEQALSTLSRDLPQAILISGAKGVGITVVAKTVAGASLAAVVEPTNTKDAIDYDTGTISVDAIRQLYERTRAVSAKQQVYILNGADRLSLGAQAAFLKLLEEPTANTHFILTSHSPQSILPTIHSRTQNIHVQPITITQTNAYIDSFGITDERKRAQLSFIAGGLPEELARLVADTDYFNERAETITDSRTFLSGTTFERLLIIQKYQQNRQKALRLLESAIRVTRHSLRQNPQSNLISILERLAQVEENIMANGNVRLQLTAFVVQ